MFRTKICGITNVEDARAAAAAGADAIGLNFYDRSPRYVDVETARAIVAEIPPEVVSVGVFVNTPPDVIGATCAAAGLSGVQLHGDEPPASIVELPDQILVIRAHRWGQETLAPLAEYLQDAMRNGRGPDAVLIDACSDTAYGGTGHTIDWQRLVDQRQLCNDWPLILAGGLNSQNVGQAIRIVSPDAVDVASGVESSPGKKNQDEVAAFVQQANRAFSTPGNCEN